MSISPIGSNPPITRLQGSKATGGAQGTPEAGQSASDTVEISDAARYLGILKDPGGGPVRTDKVQAAKDAIAAGTYETPERINGTVDSLLSDLQTEYAHP